MMDAYGSLTEAYDDLFPVNPDTIRYLSRAGLRPGGRVLDVGCAAGAHPRAFAAAGFGVLGVDPSAAMIEAARARGGADEGTGTPRFETGGMLDLERLFPPGSQDAVTCLGNTLPHLGDEGEVREFLRQTLRVLAPGGFLILQFLNYRRLLSERPAFLPRVETPKWTFERAYDYEEGRVVFRTRLLDASGRVVSSGETLLLPVEVPRVRSISVGLGFRPEAEESDWTGEPFRPDASFQAVLRFSAP